MDTRNGPGNDSCDILACQLMIPPTLTEKSRREHVDTVISRISMTLKARYADLVVLPELSTVDYSRLAFEQLDAIAETLDGRSVNQMQALAQSQQTAILFGMPRVESDEFYISQIIIDKDGALVGCYDKLHICQYGASMEKEYFQRGNHLTIFEVAGFRFAPTICYDIRIPELSRVLTLDHEVDCILHCGAYYRDESFASWHAFAETRAIENQIYLLSLNRAGNQYGNSIFCLPWMDENKTAVNFSVNKEDFRFLTLERSEITRARQQYTFLIDRLNDYQILPTS